MSTSTSKRASASGKFPITPSSSASSAPSLSASSSAGFPSKQYAHSLLPAIDIETTSSADSQERGSTQARGNIDDESYDNSKSDRLRSRRLALLAVFALALFVVSIFVLSLSPAQIRDRDAHQFALSQLQTDPQSNAAWVEPARTDIHNQQAHNSGAQQIKAVEIKLDDPEEDTEEVQQTTTTTDSPVKTSTKTSVKVIDNHSTLGDPDGQGCVRSIPASHFNGKHIVEPPTGPVTLVCCQTTKGVLNVAVHRSWAPNGADRFLDMVRSGFFETEVPLFRALKNFLVQFGLAGNPEVQRIFHEKGNLVDDPNWLPEGPPGRIIDGVTRFQRGYWAYAGAGKNSRGTQLIMAFQDNQYLGGGSPWEVPFGQLVGEASFETADKIYTGYGESPSQGKIMNRGKSYTKEEFPLMDYINECKVTAENLEWKWQKPAKT